METRQRLSPDDRSERKEERAAGARLDRRSGLMHEIEWVQSVGIRNLRGPA
jgi:hypothetical protein